MDKEILEMLKVEKLMPVQEEALPLVFSGKNVLVVAPTASGKTLIGEAAMLKAIKEGKRAIYVSPLRALTSEKFEEFKRFGIANIGISTGDITYKDPYLKYNDAIFVSIEKLDSLIRSDLSILNNLGAIVFDEVHLLDDESRGPTLEFLIALINYLYPKAQKIYLSATIGNPKELANWLKAELVYSTYRPIKLYKKILLDNLLINGNEKEIIDIGDPILNIVNYLVTERKQFIIFASTRKLSEDYALKISPIVYRWAKENQEELRNIAEEIKNAIEPPTKMSEMLATAIKNGVAFHHAGLVGIQRKIIEDKFKSGIIKAVCATPTLAMGVNLPANTVVISSIYRRTVFGSEPLRAFEMEQMAGRAGRPKYDKEGTVVYIARNTRDREYIEENYLNPVLEPIRSKFYGDQIARIYSLALICMNLANNIDSIEEFFGRLYGKVERFQIINALNFLEENGFIIKENGKIKATPIGKIVNELYIDPATAVIYMYYLKHGREDEFNYLHAMLCGNEVVYPLSYREEEKIEEEREMLDLDIPEDMVDEGKYNSAIFLAHVLSDWINEKSEKEIEDNYGIQPGILYQILETSRWLSYSIYRLGRALKIRSKFLRTMVLRIDKGVREELLPLISIPKIGRMRARKLYNAGIKSISDIRKAGLQKMKTLLGDKIGEDIYIYCSQNISTDNEKLI